MSEIGDLRIIKNRAQRLIEIDHSYNTTQGHRVRRVWRDLEKAFVHSICVNVDSGWHCLVDLLDTEYLAGLPEDCEEVTFE